MKQYIQMQNEKKEIYLLNDFNCDILVKAKKPITKQLLEVCKYALLEQMINEQTRITEHSKTALDLSLDIYISPGACHPNWGFTLSYW